MAEEDFDLDRFVEAQRGTYESALAELRAGAKRSHWMWFIFPQIDGLGESAMSRRYAIRSLAEARAFLAHPVLGPRLIACLETLDMLAESDIGRVLGTIDALKFRSSLTLFAEAAPGNATVATALARWYAGTKDAITLRILAKGDEIHT